MDLYQQIGHAMRVTHSFLASLDKTIKIVSIYDNFTHEFSKRDKKKSSRIFEFRKSSTSGVISFLDKL